jgi:predicted CopG family antitoxin
MPPKRFKSLTVREDVYNELEKIKKEKGMLSIGDVIEDLVKKSSLTISIDISDYRDKICEAIKIDKNLYLVDCSGKKAIMPFSSLKILSDRFGLIIRLKE